MCGPIVPNAEYFLAIRENLQHKRWLLPWQRSLAGSADFPRLEVSRNKAFHGHSVLTDLLLRASLKGWIDNWMWVIIRMFPWTERVSSHILFACHNAVHFKSYFRLLRGYIKRERRKKDTKVTVQTQETQKGCFKHINAGHVVNESNTSNIINSQVFQLSN